MRFLVGRLLEYNWLETSNESFSLGPMQQLQLNFSVFLAPVNFNAPVEGFLLEWVVHIDVHKIEAVHRNLQFFFHNATILFGYRRNKTTSQGFTNGSFFQLERQECFKIFLGDLFFLIFICWEAVVKVILYQLFKLLFFYCGQNLLIEGRELAEIDVFVFVGVYFVEQLVAISQELIIILIALDSFNQLCLQHHSSGN